MLATLADATLALAGELGSGLRMIGKVVSAWPLRPHFATYASARAVGLGLIGIVPSVVALVLVLGSMRGLGLAFNALTATVASIAVGIGVRYGIH